MRRSQKMPLLLIVVVVIAWATLGYLFSNPYYRLIMAIVPIWAIFALSWNMFSGYSGLISFGHAAFFGLGAYTVVLSLRHLGLTPWLGIPLGFAVGGAAGAAIGYLTLRLKGIYFALSMLAYPLVLVYVFEWLGFQEVTLPMKRDNPIAYMQFGDYWTYTLIALVVLTAVLIASLRIERTRFGMSLFAIKQNELAAEASGVDTFRWQLRALILSGAIAAAAGGLYSTVVLVVTPSSVFGLVTSAQAVILTIFGGAGVLWGPLIGAAIFVPLGEILQAKFGDILPGIQGVMFGAAIIVIVLLAPEGVYWRIRDALAKRRAPVVGQAAVAALHTERAKLPPSTERPIVRAGSPLLSVQNVSRFYGGLKAVNDVSFDVGEGEIVGIIGPNGAGKTTLFNLLNGIVPLSAGEVRFRGDTINGLKPNRICRLGIGRTFQVVRPFPRMSVLENVVVGAYVAHDTEVEAWQAAEQAVRRVGLGGRARAPAGRLTNKELRLMELARAIAGQPKLVLMDEPLAGLGATETDDLIAVIRRLRDEGITIVIIEHTMHAMVSVVDRFVVLNQGEFLAEGEPVAITRDKRVIEAYLGRKWAIADAAN
jgi:ABC-type branched-subunit amino acid transport system ATPase component/ABC-type branched-subunit amino acid transport system permease subunit